jgi:hypothetical protein
MNDESSSPLSFKLSQWQGDLSRHLAPLPLSLHTIPGSHDAGAYNLSSSEIAPFAPALLHKCCIIKTCCGCVVRSFALAQSDSLYEQMTSGSRYLDVRVSLDEKKDLLRTEHGLYGLPIRELLEQVSLFIQDHPTEIIIIHLRHFSINNYYEMETSHHQALIKMLQKLFSIEQFVRRNELQLSYSVLKERKRSVVVLYGCTPNCCNVDWIHFEKDVLSEGVGWLNCQNQKTLVERFIQNVNDHQTPNQKDTTLPVSRDAIALTKPKPFYKVAAAITPNGQVIKDGVLNCIFCFVCRCICPMRCLRPVSLREISDSAGDVLIDTFKELRARNARVNIVDMDFISRQQQRSHLMEAVILLNVPTNQSPGVDESGSSSGCSSSRRTEQIVVVMEEKEMGQEKD